MNIYTIATYLLKGESVSQEVISISDANLLSDMLARHGLVMICKSGLVFARSEVLN